MLVETYSCNVSGQPRSYENIALATTVRFDEADQDQVEELKLRVRNGLQDDLRSSIKRDQSLHDEDERVQRELNRARSAEQERQWAAERAANAPFKVTPEMLAGLSTVRDKAFQAARLSNDHLGDKRAEEAQEKALALFGLDIPFMTDDDGTHGELDGVVFNFTTYDYFNVVVTIGETLVGLDRIDSIEKLGRAWRAAEQAALTDAADDGEDDDDEL